MNGEVHLRLTDRGILLVLAALGFAWLLRHATHIFVVLFLAILLAAAVSRVALRLGRWGIGRAASILLTYLAILAVLAGIVALIVPLLAGEARALRDNLPAYQDEANALLARLPHRGGAPLQVDDLAGRATGLAQGAALAVSRSLVDAGTSLVTLLLILVLAFFLAVDERFPQRVVTRFLPPAARVRALRLLSRMGDGLGTWVRAQLLVGLFFGIAFGLGLALLRVPYALTIGTAGATLEIIPYVGGLITIALALLVAATTGKLWLLAAVLVWYTIVANLEAHIVYPKLVGEIVGLNPLVVVLALFLGAETLGIPGALLAVPLAVVGQILLDEFYVFPADAGAAAPLQPGQVPPSPGRYHAAQAPDVAPRSRAIE